MRDIQTQEIIIQFHKRLFGIVRIMIVIIYRKAVPHLKIRQTFIIGRCFQCIVLGITFRNGMHVILDIVEFGIIQIGTKRRFVKP